MNIKSSNLNIAIRRVENQWLEKLFTFVKALFNQTWLPSHDHTHHLRVWGHAKSLVEALYQKDHLLTETKLEQLIIASFFHDTGLIRTLDASHGKESREICRNYLAGQSCLSADSVSEILDAVEKHDDKSYEGPALSAKDLPEGLTTLLAVCDDLDAFGAIGVFRYLEIYMQRGITMPSMSTKIIENLEKRLGYLMRSFGELKEFIQVQQRRCQYTMDFYNALDSRQFSSADKQDQIGAGKVTTLLIEKVLHDKIHFTELISHIENFPLDPYSKSYFNQLQNELQGTG